MYRNKLVQSKCNIFVKNLVNEYKSYSGQSREKKNMVAHIHVQMKYRKSHKGIINFLPWMCLAYKSV